MHVWKRTCIAISHKTTLPGKCTFRRSQGVPLKRSLPPIPLIIKCRFSLSHCSEKQRKTLVVAARAFCRPVRELR